MIEKPLKKTLLILQLEALLRRLPANHHKRDSVSNILGRYLAGYKGEKSLVYHLSFLDERKYHILHEIRLANGQNHFQIDVIILTPHFFLLVEAKNLVGEIFFDEKYHQLIQLKNSEKICYPDPLIQVDKQRKLLSEWLNHHKYTSVPMDILVTISNSQTIISASEGYKKAVTHVTHCENFLNKFYQSEKNFQKEVFTQKELKKLSRYLIKHHEPYGTDVLEKFNISHSELVKGVFCLNINCYKTPMHRIKARWVCPRCSEISKDAHLQALKDYKLIIGSTITNQQFRNFLLIPSVYSTSRLLASLQFSYEGSTRGRTYHITIDHNEL